MASVLPTLSKTWQFVASFLVPAQGSALATNREIILRLKNALVATDDYVDAGGTACTPANLCTVAASSNGTVADGNDNWQAAADLVWGADGDNPHSWIVFEQPALGAGMQMLWSLGTGDANGTWLAVYINSGTAFSGGTTTTRPTSADETLLWANVYGGADVSDVACRVSCVRSSDGKAWRLFSVRTDTSGANTLILWEEAQSFIGAAWATKTMGICLANQSVSIAGWNTLGYGGTTAYVKTRVEGAWHETMFASPWVTPAGSYALENPYNWGAANGKNSIVDAWPAYQPILFPTYAPAGSWEYIAIGTLADLWIGAFFADGTNNGVSLKSFPATGTTHQFFALGGLIVPWCKTAPVPTLGTDDLYVAVAAGGGVALPAKRVLGRGLTRR